MYARYEPSERVFVDREEYIDWMTEALTRCQDKTVVLHLRGIGGIGKTALFDHWHSTVDAAILLDCGRVINFFDRLDVLAKGAVRLGIQLRRFDLLWSIRLRFIKGVEPAKTPGRAWALDVIEPIPFIGSIVNISKAIRTIGTKLGSRLKRRFGDVATWLRDRLGIDYSAKLLEILWKEPHHAEFLFLDALLEDLNGRKNSQQPLLMLLDHFEHVDAEDQRWRYSGRKISEAELWYVFLSSLNTTVGVTASRKGLPEQVGSDLTIEEAEITELDESSCRELLSERGVTEKTLQTQIVSVSGGNPFVLNAICDTAEMNPLTLEDIESLRADTLSEVRLKTWRRLFSQAEGLLEIIDRAGLIPFFDQKILGILIPHMKTDHWDRLTRLSFVRDRADGTWELHDLARDLVLAELGGGLKKQVLEIVDLLEQSAIEQNDITLLGMALSAQALAAEPDAIAKVGELVHELIMSDRHADALALLTHIRFETDEGKAMLQWHRGRVLDCLSRFNEAKQEYRAVLRLHKKLALKNPDEFLVFVAWTLGNLAILLRDTGSHIEAEEIFQEALELLEGLTEMGEKPMFGYPDIYLDRFAYTLWQFAGLLHQMGKLREAETTFEEALRLNRELAEKDSLYLPNVADILHWVGILYLQSGRVDEGEQVLREAFEIAKKPSKEMETRWSQVLADSQVMLAAFFIFTGRANEGEDEIREAIELYRELVKKAPHKYLWHLGFGLNTFGILLRHINKLSEAETALREAVEIYRELSVQAPDVFSPWFATTLANFAILLKQTNKLAKAEKAHQEAIEIFRKFAGQTPEVYLPRVAYSLTNFAVFLRQTGKLKQAEDSLREALKIRRSLATEAPNFYLQHVATSLNNLAFECLLVS